jgi:hypothetical protein
LLDSDNGDKEVFGVLVTEAAPAESAAAPEAADEA